MERNLNIPTKGEVARQAALQEAARALAGRPRKPVRVSRHTKSQVEEQGLFDALALTTSPGRPLAIKPLSIPPATAKVAVRKQRAATKYCSTTSQRCASGECLEIG